MVEREDNEVGCRQENVRLRMEMEQLRSDLYEDREEEKVRNWKFDLF